MRKLIEEKGSVTLIVFVTVFFLVTTVLGMFLTNSISKQSQEKEIERIKKIYEKGADNLQETYKEELAKQFVEGGEENFEYTGDVQTITLGPGEYKLEVWGAEGGYYNETYESSAGKGGYSYGTLKLTNTTKLYIYVGECPKDSNSTTKSFGGGGETTGGLYQRRGGGASDIRIGEDSLYARVIVAGGGGAAGKGATYSWSGTGNGAGGYGGGTSGYAGTTYNTTSTSGTGQGGTQTSGGAQGTTNGNPGGAGTFGFGGKTGSQTEYNMGAGGGGWYGGGGSPPGVGGGGGSGWVYTKENFDAGYTNSSYTGGTWLLNNQYYLTDAETIAGNQTFLAPDGTEEIGHSDDGYVRITWNGGKEPTEKVSNFEYTGKVQEWIAESTGEYKLEVWGAQGGNDPYTAGVYGGRGGYASGELRIEKDTKLYVYVGGQGTGSTSSSWCSTGGGGATDISLKGTADSEEWKNEDHFYSRILVAGGGRRSTW